MAYCNPRTRIERTLNINAIVDGGEDRTGKTPVVSSLVSDAPTGG